MNETIAGLRERISIRAFEDDPITEEVRDAIIESAIQAPSAGNQVLYTILDIRDQKIKDRLAVLCDNQPFIAAAPMVLIFLADCRRWLTIYRTAGIDARDPGAGDMLIALSDGLIAAQNSVVAAWSLGVGSCYIGDIAEWREEISPLLALRPFLIPAAMVVFGYPTRQQKNRSKPERFSKELVVCRDRYQEPDADSLRKEVERRQVGDSTTFRFDAYVSAFHDRRYDAEFAHELNRSTASYISDFLVS